MLKWPFFEFLKSKQEVFEFEIVEKQVVTERRMKGYLNVGELIAPPEVSQTPLFLPRR